MARRSPEEAIAHAQDVYNKLPVNQDWVDMQLKIFRMRSLTPDTIKTLCDINLRFARDAAQRGRWQFDKQRTEPAPQDWYALIEQMRQQPIHLKTKMRTAMRATATAAKMHGKYTAYPVREVTVRCLEMRAAVKELPKGSI